MVMPEPWFKSVLDDISTSLFSTCFVLKDPSSHHKEVWQLPKLSAFFTSSADEQIDGLQLYLSLKKELNDVKALLNDKDIQKWHEHTALTNPTTLVLDEVRRRLQPEVCTQAWCKFREILASHPSIIPESAIQNCLLQSIHLCEAPGGFIACLNHWLYSHADYESIYWNWIGTSLNPYYEGNKHYDMVSDDRLIFGTMERNWDFGIDNSGDLLMKGNFDHLVNEYGRCFDLVTADGAFDCQDQPIQQEVASYRIHYCQCVTALYLLRDGGSLVLKKFTSFEPETISLLYLLSCCFAEIHLMKPPTSKPGNSEVYLICLGFQVPSGDILEILAKHYDDAMLPQVIPINLIPSNFVDRLHQCNVFFAKCQISMIQFNLRTSELLGDANGDKTSCEQLLEELASLQRRVAVQWVQKTGQQRIRASHRLLHMKPISPWYQSYAYVCKQKTKSYIERQLEDATYWLMYIRKHLHGLHHRMQLLRDAYSDGFVLASTARRVSHPGRKRKKRLKAEEPASLPLVTGQKLSRIYSSKFIDIRLLELCNCLRDNVTSLKGECPAIEDLELCFINDFNVSSLQIRNDHIKEPSCAFNTKLPWIMASENAIGRNGRCEAPLCAQSDGACHPNYEPPAELKITLIRPFMALTRFSAGLIRCLLAGYESIRIESDRKCISMNKQPCSCNQSADHDFIADRLDQCYSFLLSEDIKEASATPWFDLLEILPVTWLADEQFLKPLEAFNTLHLYDIMCKAVDIDPFRKGDKT